MIALEEFYQISYRSTFDHHSLVKSYNVFKVFYKRKFINATPPRGCRIKKKKILPILHRHLVAQYLVIEFRMRKNTLVIDTHPPFLNMNVY